MRTLIVTISLMLILTGVGCVAISELVTPARIDARAKAYVIERGTDPNVYRGYPNLAMSNQLLKDIRAGHLTTLQEFEQAMDRENLEHGLVLGVAEADNKVAVAREEQLFGEKGLLSMGLGMLGFGTLTGVVGLMRKRPGDVTSAEMEQALAQSQGKTAEELSAKQWQFVQLVQGVQKILTCSLVQPDAVTIFKAELSKTQDTDTMIAVASVKKEFNL
jgi:hypothetical protein